MSLDDFGTTLATLSPLSADHLREAPEIVVDDGVMWAYPETDPLALFQELADRAAERPASYVAVRFHPGGNRQLVRSYAWEVGGSDSATFDATVGQPCRRTGPAPGPLPATSPARFADLTFEAFIDEVLADARPEDLKYGYSLVLAPNRRVKYFRTLSPDAFEGGDPPYFARGGIVGDHVELHLEDTTTGEARRYRRPVRKKLFGSYVANGPWGSPEPAARQLDELRARVQRL